MVVDLSPPLDVLAVGVDVALALAELGRQAVEEGTDLWRVASFGAPPRPILFRLPLPSRPISQKYREAKPIRPAIPNTSAAASSPWLIRAS